MQVYTNFALMSNSQFRGFLNTPPLWHDRLLGVEQFDLPSLSLVDIKEKTIPSNLRLGHQVEHIFKQLMEQSAKHQLLIYNLPIRKEKITLGEIDFIFRDLSFGHMIHIELSYKFYLIDPEIKDPIFSLVGPNLRDSFHQKLSKIKARQFPLLHSAEGIKALEKNNIDHRQLKHQVCFKAQLFYAYPDYKVNLELFNNKCIIGFWLNLTSFQEDIFKEAHYYHPSKSEWIYPVHNQVNWCSHENVMLQILPQLNDNYAPMLWMKSKLGKLKKIFIVWW